MVRRSRPKGVWHTCPVCGYPTLGVRGDYEICNICWWEDDGQDDADAEVARGGPNGSLSLKEARENFAAYRRVYRPSGQQDDLQEQKYADMWLVAEVLIVVFEAIRKASYTNHHVIRRLWTVGTLLGGRAYVEIPEQSNQL